MRNKDVSDIRNFEKWLETKDFFIKFVKDNPDYTSSWIHVCKCRDYGKDEFWYNIWFEWMPGVGSTRYGDVTEEIYNEFVNHKSKIREEKLKQIID